MSFASTDSSTAIPIQPWMLKARPARKRKLETPSPAPTSSMAAES